MQQQLIKTRLISTPTISVPADFTALHLAHISWDLYSNTAPTQFAGEFSISDGGDFAMYCIEDSKQMSDHFYECAFAIGRNVEDNVEYSIQDAFDLIDEIYADTVVREDVSTQLAHAIQQFVNSESYATHTGYISEDYSAL